MSKQNIEMEEYVLAFPIKLLDSLGYFQGLNYDIQDYLKEILTHQNYSFIKRKDAEINPNYKQLIPYAILFHNNKIFIYQRGKLLAEKRLLENYSIGIGGHITTYDSTFFNQTYDDGFKRELNEEIDIDSKYENKIVALINDDSNDVGRVHFGVVHLLSLENPNVTVKEKSIKKPSFLTIEEIMNKYNELENWSKICLNNIEDIIKLYNQS